MKSLLKISTPVVLTLVVYPWQIHGYINGLDEGTFMAIAQALFSGKLLYKDVWFQYGPLLALPLKAAVTLFPPTLLSLRLCIWVANVLGLICIYLVILKWIPSLPLRLMGALAMWVIPLAAHTTTIPMAFRYGPPFLSLLFWTDRRWDRFLAGFVAGVSFFLSQEVATAVIVGGFVYFFLSAEKKRVVFDYVGGVLAAFVLFGVFISLQYGIYDYGRCTIQQTAGMVAARKGFFVGSVIENTALVFPLLMVAVATFTSYKQPRVIGSVFFVLLASIPAWGRTDRWHIYYSLSPAVLLALVWANAKGGRALGGVCICLLGLTLPSLISDLHRSQAQKNTVRTLELPRSGGVKIPFGQANGYEYLTRFVNDHVESSRSILMFPYDGALYFLSNRNFAGRYPLLIEAVSSAQQQETAEVIRSSPDLQWIVWDKQNASFDGRAVTEKINPIVAAIHENFALFQSEGPFDFFQRVEKNK